MGLEPADDTEGVLEASSPSLCVGGDHLVEFNEGISECEEFMVFRDKSAAYLVDIGQKGLGLLQYLRYLLSRCMQRPTQFLQVLQVFNSLCELIELFAFLARLIDAIMHINYCENFTEHSLSNLLDSLHGGTGLDLLVFLKVLFLEVGVVHSYLLSSLLFRVETTHVLFLL